LFLLSSGWMYVCTYIGTNTYVVMSIWAL
jgi:hypothetical protein